MNDEKTIVEQNEDDIDTASSTNEGKKSNEKFKKIGSIIKVATSTVVNTVNKGIDYGKKLYEEKKEEVEFIKHFNNNTYFYEVLGTKGHFRAFRDASSNRLLVRIDDSEVTKLLKCDSILICKDDESKLVVTSVDVKQSLNFEFPFNDEMIVLSVFAVNVRTYEKEKDKAITYNIQQTMNFTDSTVNGNIVQTNEITTALNSFENELRSFKPGILKRNTHNDSLKIYGDVKELIIQGDKKNPLVYMFMKLLGSLGGTLLASFISILSK
jgi:hypothetical protein